MRENFEAMGRNAANFVPLTPLSFLSRTARIFPDRVAWIYGARRETWAGVEGRCRAIAAALAERGIRHGDTVSVLAPNIPELFELHFAVPMAGAVLNTINTRLEAETVAYILEHSDCRLIIADTASMELVTKALAGLGTEIPVIDINDAQADGGAGFGGPDYEALATGGDPRFDWAMPEDEWQALALNYTSGTSGRPKGVVYHHRGAYLMSMGTIAAWAVPQHATYLSVVPMFHCNGWNHPWAMTMVAARMIFVRDNLPAKIFRAIEKHGVSHFGCAPVILAMLADAAGPEGRDGPPVRVLTAGAPPPAAVLERARSLGFEVMQVYGLTETYGHVTQCVWREEWDALGPEEQAALQARQGVAFPMVEETTVIDRETGREVPQNGTTQGEIAIRGNTVMKGYYKDPAATEAAFAGGRFWSGDGAVLHQNGYAEIRDRLKDVIISGGENISSIEVEGVLFRHPAVQAAAVVATPDAKWGEVPMGFVEVRPGVQVTEEEILAFCRERLAGFKRPKRIVFTELPKTATGKVQKFVLRQRASQE